MPTKRKRIVLGLSQKLEIIKRLKGGATVATIAREYGVGGTTVNEIKRNAGKIEQYVLKIDKLDGDVKMRKTMKPAKYSALDTAMYRWFVHERSKGVKLSGPLIMTKAVELNKQIKGDPSFKASVGWLDKFKFRHGIRHVDITGDKIIVDFETLHQKLQLDVGKEQEDQMSSCNKTGDSLVPQSGTTTSPSLEIKEEPFSETKIPEHLMDPMESEDNQSDPQILPVIPQSTLKSREKPGQFAPILQKKHRSNDCRNKTAIHPLPSFENEFKIFGQHIAAQLRSLPLADAIQLQQDIQNLITTARLRNLHSGNSISWHFSSDSE